MWSKRDFQAENVRPWDSALGATQGLAREDVPGRNIFSMACRRMFVGAGYTPCSLRKMQHIQRLRDLLATVKNSATGKVLCPDRTVGGSRNSGMEKEAGA